MATREVQVSKKGKARPLLTLVRGDNRTQIIRLIVDRYSGGIDLANLAWDVVATNASGESDIYYIPEAQVEDTVIVCDWVVRGIATEVEGETQFELEGIDRDENGEEVYVWQSGIYIINVTADLNHTATEDDEAQISAVQELILTVKNELPTVYEARDAANAAAQAANDSAAAADAAAQSANDAAASARTAADKANAAAETAPIMVNITADCASIDGDITVTGISMPPSEIRTAFAAGKKFRAFLAISINGSSQRRYLGYVDLCMHYLNIGSSAKNQLQWTGTVTSAASGVTGSTHYRVAVALENADDPISGTVTAYRIANYADVEAVDGRLDTAEKDIDTLEERVDEIEKNGAGGACGCEYATDEEILSEMLALDALPTLVDAEGDALIGADGTILLI